MRLFDWNQGMPSSWSADRPSLILPFFLILILSSYQDTTFAQILDNSPSQPSIFRKIPTQSMFNFVHHHNKIRLSQTCFYKPALGSAPVPTTFETHKIHVCCWCAHNIQKYHRESHLYKHTFNYNVFNPLDPMPKAPHWIRSLC